MNLDRTVITAPFDGRVAEADVEISQFIGSGTKMGTLDGVAAAEIDVQIPPAQMARFVRLAFGGLRSPKGVREFSRGIGVLSAVVGIGFTGIGPVWKAEVKRISDTVDPATRSFGVIVSVANPYGNLRPGDKPPLIKGMFAKVQLRGPPVHNVMLLPRNAVVNGRVKIVGKDKRLRFANVEISFAFQDVAVLQSGLEGGTKVVISDLSPAIEGMLLNPVEDGAAAIRLNNSARPDDELTAKSSNTGSSDMGASNRGASGK